VRVVLFPSAYAPAVGGVEELTARLAFQLQAVGDDVEVWTIRHPTSLPAHEEIEGVTVRRFSTPLPTSDPRELLRFPLRFLSAIVDLFRATRRKRPDVLHVQCFSANGVYAMLLGAAFRIPVVVTLQGETVMDDNDVFEHSAVLRAALRLGLRRADVVTGCSRYTLDDAVARFGLPTSAGLVIPNGVDLETPRVAGKPVLPDRYVFAVGRIVQKKGFDLLLAAFAQVAPQQPNVSLVIAGQGRELEGLRVHAADLGLADRVVFPGVLSRAEVASAMAGAAVFVLPSRIEPFGIVVLEALRAGTPAIVSCHGGASEIARDGVEALVVDPADASELAGAVLRLLGDHEVAARLAAAGRERVDAFSWQAIAARYRALYRPGRRRRPLPRATSSR
jgi:glycogen(starch) synthase